MKLVRRVSALLALALVGTGLVALAPPAAALQGTVPAAAAPIWQTNGTVRAIAAVGGVVYVGGDFTAVRPPGAAPETQQVTRNRLAAFDATTGALITSFNPDASAAVRSLEVSPDGSRLYVGGDFTSIAGQTRNRLAAFDTSTRSLTSWAPAANGRVSGIAAQGSTVWVGGYFSQISGTARSRVAALDAGSGAVRPGFAPTTDNVLYDIEASPQGDRLYLAGAFLSVNGDTNQQVAAVVDATNGALLPFPAAQQAIPRRTSGCIVEMTDITVDETSVYYSAEGTGGGCFDGTFAAFHDGGTTKWISRCLGATQGMALLNGMLYTGSHAHDCSGDVSFDPDAFSETGWARGLSRKLLARSAETGQLGSWYPNTNGGPPGGQGPRVLATDGQQMFVGGEFTAVNGTAQQGVTRFSPAGPFALPERPVAPRAVARGDGTVNVLVQAPLDNDDTDLEIRLYRSGAAAPIATADVHSLFWRQPVAGFEDTGLTPGSTVSYSVEVAEKNGPHVSPRSPSASVTVLADAPPYQAAVAKDDPVLHWRMGDGTSTFVSDASAELEGGTLYGSATFGQAGAVAGDSAMRFDGSTGHVSSETAAPGPGTFSVEAWVNTTTTSGGRIVGFGNNRGGLDFDANPQVSSSYDKHLYMTNDGRLVFGVYVGGFFHITSAPGFNDGQWHHVVGTQGPNGMVLYVDGVRVGRNGQSQNQSYTGVWRVGGDNLNGWPNRPSSNYLAGVVDEVAVYHAALPATSVAAHYTASGRTPDLPPLPTDEYAQAVVTDDPSFFWRLDETGGTAAADASGRQESGVIVPPVTYGVDGSLGTGSRALRLGGNPANVRTEGTDTPSTYAAELWFRTTTTTGGKLIGFGNEPTGNSSNYDKHVYMTNDGRLVFGVYLGGFTMLTSPASYNDGQWHHVVASQGPQGMRLYVDNSLVGSNGTSANQVYAGYWRVGGDNLNAWPNRPSTDWFSGDVDEVAVYAGPLTAEQVDAHYRASGRAGPDTTAPTVTVTAPADGAEVPAGDVSVTADATDAGAIASVELLVDGDVVGMDSEAPYSVTWSATAGEHVLTARATDGAGNTGTSTPVTVTVVAPDTTAPDVEITAPISGQEVFGEVVVEVDATDDRGVTEVTLLVDGEEQGTDDAAPYEIPWTAVEEGSHELTARAVDAAGNATVSAPLIATVPADTTPPSQVTGLAADDVTATTASLTWDAATDDRAVGGYVVLRDGAELPGMVTTTAFEDTSLDPETTYIYQVLAVDAVGNRGPASAGVDVTTLPAQTALFTDDWARPDGASWPAPWVTSSANGGSVTTASGTGRLGFADTSGAWARAQLGVDAETDTDTVLRYRWSDNSVRAYFSVFTRGSGGWANAYRPRNGYGFELSSTSGTLYLMRVVNGTVSVIGTVPGAQQMGTDPQMMRLRVVGDQVHVRIWAEGTPEPSQWTASVTDTTVTDAGHLHLSVVRAGPNVGAKYVEVDDLTVTRLQP